MKQAVFSTNPITGTEYYHGFQESSENESALKHIESLGRQGACVMTVDGKVPVSIAFYAGVLQMCQKNRINCIGYDLKIPETDEPMTLAIWRNGHVDSGSTEAVQKCMEQY